LRDHLKSKEGKKRKSGKRFFSHCVRKERERHNFFLPTSEINKEGKWFSSEKKERWCTNVPPDESVLITLSMDEEKKRRSEKKTSAGDAVRKTNGNAGHAKFVVIKEGKAEKAEGESGRLHGHEGNDAQGHGDSISQGTKRRKKR